MNGRRSSPLARAVRRNEADDVKRLKELERENAQLKRLVADQELENADCGDCQGESACNARVARRGPAHARAAQESARAWAARRCLPSACAPSA
jgi:hypothetical protein